ncbi:MAG: hypothetical protein OXK79_10835 [Chloroflexota bacterium]|nr:hypothetical protein [Chloroflexota bacterium]
MFFSQWDDEDWRQLSVVAAYVALGIAGIAYALLNAEDIRTLLGNLADIGGALFVIGIIAEGAIWLMVIAFGKLREARREARRASERARAEGRAEGIEVGKAAARAAMIQRMRDAGIPEEDIQRVAASTNHDA